MTVTGSSVEFDEGLEGTISVFSLDEKSTGVCESGLKYSLDNAELLNSNPLGVSNEFKGEKAKISVDTGHLLIVYDRK